MYIVSVSTSGRFGACWDLISQMCRRDVGGTTTTKVAPIKPEASSDADKTTRQLINQQIHMRRLFVYILVTMNIKKY